jgi:protocatechuate 3,4-dioxygenase beta subunit
MIGRAILALLAVVLLAAAAAAQPAPAAPPAKNGAILRGRVTAADTGRPLRRAQITAILLGSIQERRTTSTDSRGDYELRELPAGRYTLNVTRSGYLPWEYGRRAPGEPGKTIEVDEGAALDKIDLAMPRAGVIGGRVIDETGEPVPGVTVWVMRSQFFRGRRTLVPAGSIAHTDDTGTYRASSLLPGNYVVVAMLNETWVAAGEKKQVLGYAPTFFPSTATAADAQLVSLQPGKVVAIVDIALVAMPAATITGTAARADGTPLAGASVNLSQNIIGPNGSSFRGVASARVDADGSWRFRDVPAAEYELNVSANNTEGVREAAVATVVVSGADIEGLSLVAQAPVSVTGELLTDQGTPLPPGSARPRVVADSLVPGSSRPLVPDSSDDGLVTTTGAFSLKTMAGPAVVQVWALPKGWALKSVEAGGRESPDNVIDVKAGGKLEGVKIVVTNRLPVITARVVDDKGADAEGVVLLFPEDQARWLGMADNIRYGRADQKGQVRLEHVPPGDYLAIALTTVQPWQVADPEFLATVKDAATKVTVREGQPSQLTLKIRP